MSSGAHSRGWLRPGYGRCRLKHRRHTPRKGYPVRCGLSIPSLMSRNTGSPAGACHRARIRATRWLAMTSKHTFTTSPRDAPERLAPHRREELRKEQQDWLGERQTRPRRLSSLTGAAWPLLNLTMSLSKSLRRGSKNLRRDCRRHEA